MLGRLSLGRTSPLAVVPGQTTTDWDDELWHHFVGVWDSNTALGTLQVYVDGTVGTNTIPTQGISISSSAVNVYAGTTSVFSNHFEGNVDEMSIWNKALTSVEILEIYNNGDPINLNDHSKFTDVISWWRMGDRNDTSTTTFDQSGSNDGTLEAGATIERSEPNVSQISLTCDGATGHVVVPDAVVTAFVNLTAVTVSVWATRVNTTERNVLFNLTIAGVENKFLVEFTAADFVVVGGKSIAGEVNRQRRTTGKFTNPNVWYHIVGILDLTGKDILIYVNNVQQSVVDEFGGAAFQNNFFSNEVGNFNYIGAQTSSAAGDEFHEGQIDELSMWNRVLTPSEITEIYNCGIPSNLTVHSANSNLIHWWPLGDKDTSPTAIDRINADNGTLSGGVSFANIVPPA